MGFSLRYYYTHARAHCIWGKPRPNRCSSVDPPLLILLFRYSWCLGSVAGRSYTFRVLSGQSTDDNSEYDTWRRSKINDHLDRQSVGEVGRNAGNPLNYICIRGVANCLEPFFFFKLDT